MLASPRNCQMGGGSGSWGMGFGDGTTLYAHLGKKRLDAGGTQRVLLQAFAAYCRRSMQKRLERR